MKKQTLILLIALAFAQAVFAQSFISLNGKVTDKQNDKAVAYATISIKNKAIGTVTNTEGSFIFHIPQKYKNDSLVVSSMGYKSYAIKIKEIANSKLNIQLEKKVYELSEVDVKPKDALEIVKQAIAKIPENYPTQPINMEGFYREMTFENDTCVEMAEAACEFYYRPYEKYDYNEAMDFYFLNKNIVDGNYFVLADLFNYPLSNPKDILQIKEARASKLHHKYRFKIVPDKGPLGLVGYDIKNWMALDGGSDFLRKNNFSLERITKYDDKSVYVIIAKPKSNRLNKLFESRYFIGIKSSAIIAVEEIWKKHEIKTRKYWNPALYKKKKRKCNDINNINYNKILIKYKKNKGKWYLNYIKNEIAFDYIFSEHYIFKTAQSKISYKLQSELLINDLFTENVKEMHNKKHFENHYMNVICNYDLDYNEKFWKNYNAIAKTNIQDSIIKQLETKQPLIEQFKNRLVKNDSLLAPKAIKIPYKNLQTKIIDNYYWMQDIKNEQLLKYIEEENNFTENYMIPLKQLKRNLVFEMLKREVRDTAQISTKIKKSNYEYYYKQEKGANYANIYRKKFGKNTREELILDIVKKSQFHTSYWAAISSIKPDNSIIAYEEPITSGYNSRIVFKDLNTGKNIDSLYKADNIIWIKNEDKLLYTNWDETNRVNKLFKHKIGTKQNQDELLYFEKNKLNNISLNLFEEKYVLMESYNDFNNNDVYLIKQNTEHVKLLKIASQSKGISHFVQIKSDTLYSLTNEADGKTVLYFSSMNKPERKHWKEITRNTGKAFFAGYIILKNYIVTLEEENMQKRFRIINKQGKTIKLLEFNNEETYSIGIEPEKSTTENSFKFYYESLATPKKIFEYNIEKDLKTFLKQDKIRGFIAENYKTKLLWAISKDGTKVPISLVYNKKRVKRNGKSPVLLTAYGSYGSYSMHPSFSSIKLSLLDRGIIYAIAHVRGGSELGNKWHENAMQLKKKNTFHDFIACAEYLIEKKYTSKGNIIAKGGSAGGLVMGVAANWKPELFNTIILEVPELDVLNAITDTTAKFNSVEKGELGNPKNDEVFNYIKSYSPYDNIKAQNYPNMLFTTGLNDTRVEYWQVVKTVAKLRALKTDNNTLLLKTDLYAGHNSYSGLYNYIENKAFKFAFILNNLNIRK